MIVATVLALAAVGGGLLVRFRRRRPRIDGLAAERALQARIERAGAQNRATQMHPDCVRYWMRPH